MEARNAQRNRERGRRPANRSRPAADRLRLAAGLVLLLLGGFLAWRVLFAARTGQRAGFRNLLLVTLDTTRADHLGCYGHAAAATPVLDRLAAEGALFERCVAPAPYTLPCHASLMTGLYPRHHGVRVNGAAALPEARVTLAEALSQAGFATGAAVSAVVLDSRFGLGQGFDRYDDDLSSGGQPGVLQYRETRADDTLRRALRWIDERGEERFFLWTHFFDPHDPYEPPEPFAARFANAPYDGEIAYADAQLGELLAGLQAAGRLEETLVVILGDHGESLGEHGESTHGHFVYLATTRVPLIVWHPALPAGRRIATTVSSTDVAPTVLELLGVDPLPETDGTSQAAALLSAETPATATAVYSEAALARQHPGWADLNAVRTDRASFILAPRPEWYDLEADPGETRDLYPEDPTGAAALEQKLRAWLARDAAQTGAAVEDDAGFFVGIAELGYVSVRGATDTRAEPGTGEEARDPKDTIFEVERVRTALELVRRREWSAAETMLAEIVAEDPADPSSPSLLLGVRLRLGEREAAREQVAARVAVQPTPALELLLGMLERSLGGDGWRERVRNAARAGARARPLFLAPAEYLRQSGDEDGAWAFFNEALQSDPASAEARLGRGRIFLARGELDAADADLRRALDAAPDSVVVMLALARVEEARGEPDLARAWLREARRVAPAAPEPLLARARLDFGAEREQEGREAAESALELGPLPPLSERPEVFSLMMPGLARGSVEALVGARAAAQGRMEAWSAVAELAAAAGLEELASRAGARAEPLRDALRRL